MPHRSGRHSPPGQSQQLTISRYNLLLEKLLIGESVDNLLQELVALIQEKQPDCVAAVTLNSDDGKSMHFAAGPDLPAPLRQQLNYVDLSSDQTPFGRAAAARQMIIGSDFSVADDAFGQTAAANGLSSCWAQPVISTKGDLLGAFALFPRSKPQPTGHDLLLIHESARLAQLIMEVRSFQRCNHPKNISEFTVWRMDQRRAEEVGNFAALGIQKCLCCTRIPALKESIR